MRVSWSEAWKAVVAAILFLFGGDRLAHALYVPLGVLMLVDLGTGLWAAKARGQRITSPRMFRMTLRKFVGFAIVVVVANMMDYILMLAVGTLGAARPMLKTAIIYLATHETISVDENLYTASGIGLGGLLHGWLRRIHV